MFKSASIDRTGLGGPGGPRRRRGFTLLELVIAGTLTAALGLLLATFWAAHDRAAAEVLARGRLAREADFALESLAADLAAPMPPAPPGGDPWGRGLLERLELSPDGLCLRLHYRHAAHVPPIPQEHRDVVYEVRTFTPPEAAPRRALVRWVEIPSADPEVNPPQVVDPPGGPPRRVAWDVQAIDCRPILVSSAPPDQRVLDQPGWYEVRVTLAVPQVERRRDGVPLARAYSLVAFLP